MYSPSNDAKMLREAMKGLGTDETILIQVIANRTPEQLKIISEVYSKEFNRDLIKDIKSETSGNFKNTLVALLSPPHKYDAEELRTAAKGAGTDEKTFVEILALRSNREKAAIKEYLLKEYGQALKDLIKSETSGDFKKFLEKLSEDRDESTSVNHEVVKAKAEALYKAGEGKWGTDEDKFLPLAQWSYEEILAIDKEYTSHSKNNNTLEHAIRNEFSGDLKYALTAVVTIAHSKAEFFAQRIHEAIAGAGTRNEQLIRLLITGKPYIEEIKAFYDKKYGKSLKNAIKDDTSGDFEKLLLDLIN